MTRSVGIALRRTAGGSVIFALGLGALSSVPRQLVPVAAAAAPLLPITSTSVVAEPVVDHLRPQLRLTVYELATPVPTPAQAMTAATITPSPPARRLAAAPARVLGPVTGAANGFTYGYCTWWVAHKRYIPWRGNAAQWWWNARPFGYAEGASPQVGAVMVMGVSGSSPDGHVAYVESVGAGGSFVVSEMNWWGVPGGGWGRVDYRTVTSMRGILGFIY
jgi:surface antigen